MRNIKIANSFTDRTDSFNAWCRMIRNYPTLTAAEEAVLAEQIQKGDKNALDKLVSANLRFVITVAKKYQNQGLDAMDLIAEGNVGLVKAAESFDGSLGYKFISYAVYYIQRSIMDALAKVGSTIRKSDTHVRSISRISKAKSAFEQKYERTPSLEELAEITGIKASNIALFINQCYNATSADAPLDEEGNCLFNVIGDSESEGTDFDAVVDSTADYVRKALDRLTLRDKQIVCKYFGIGCEKQSLAEIAAYYHLSHESIRQIKNKCLKALGKDKVLKSLAYAG